jgi:hypothetical protein
MVLALIASKDIGAIPKQMFSGVPKHALLISTHTSRIDHAYHATPTGTCVDLTQTSLVRISKSHIVEDTDKILLAKKRVQMVISDRTDGATNVLTVA